MFVSKVKNKEDKVILTSDDTTMDELKFLAQRDPNDVANKTFGMSMPYMWSKALVHVYV